MRKFVDYPEYSVYAIKDGDRIVYVGCSCSPDRRLSELRHREWWQSSYEMTVLIRFNSRLRAFQWESVFISRFNPIHNVQGKVAS